MTKYCFVKKDKKDIFKALNEAFGKIGFGWYYTITDKWIENMNADKYSFVEINLFIRNNNKWSKPITAIGGMKIVDCPNFSFDENYHEALKTALNNCYNIIKKR